MIVFNEINTKSGKYYDELKYDDFCMNTNIKKCVEIINKKLSAKSAKKAPTKQVPQPQPDTVIPEKAIKSQPKPKPKPRGKRATTVMWLMWLINVMCNAINLKLNFKLNHFIYQINIKSRQYYEIYKDGDQQI